VIVYSPRYRIDIGTHVFPTSKYALLIERLQDAGLARPADIIEPEMASWEDLGLVHTDDYLEQLKSGPFRLEELAQLEVPWSQEVVDGFRLMTGGTIAAARLAARLAASGQSSMVAHLGGGLHHAFPDHGEGFCFFNDVAVATRVLLRDRLASRVAIVDLDVHQGNGTAFIFAGDPQIFTFSMHQERNYPEDKPNSSLDIGLPDGAGDGEYLARLTPALEQVFAFEPDLILYLAGADAYEDDQLGGLALTKTGLRQRDRAVLTAASTRKIPIVVCLAGGYARHLDDTVDIHYATIEELQMLRLSDLRS
jgi:acetoin utilization deacetylase AcuC-like enzyme